MSKNNETPKQEKEMIDPVYFVNKDKMIDPVYFVDKTQKSPEEKKYLLIYKYEEDKKEYNDFQWFTGRRAIYEFLKGFIADAEFIDIHDSRVLVEGALVEENISIVTFMKTMETYFNDGFDIRKYYDIDEEENENNGETE